MIELRDFDALAFAFSQPKNCLDIKTVPEDFFVDEKIAFELSGEGEHLFLKVEKKSLNTMDVAKIIARFYGVRRFDVGYSGLKDRNAVTSQWFSVYLPGKVNEEKDADIYNIETENLKVIESRRHNRKIQRGAHRANSFKLVLRKVDVSSFSVLEERLRLLKEFGFPNYFGTQRFGNGNSNLLGFLERHTDEKKPKENRKRSRRSKSLNQREGMQTSAVRSYIFNQLLSKRVEAGEWNNPLLGDVIQLGQSNKYFCLNDEAEVNAKEIHERIRAGEIHLTGFLPGEIKEGAVEAPKYLAADIEGRVADEHETMISQLCSQRIQQARRPFRTLPQNMHWSFFKEKENQAQRLELSFDLPTGAYATSLLRELCLISDQSVKRNENTAFQ